LATALTLQNEKHRQIQNFHHTAADDFSCRQSVFIKCHCAKFLHKGDVVTISPGILHWHGTTLKNSFTQMVISPNIEKDIATWLHISDNEYNSVK
jgi:hypothetical protein